MASLDQPILAVIQDFYGVLNSHSKYLEIFCNYGVQLEGWFKGELLSYFHEQKNTHRISDFDREVLCGQGKKKIDFRIDIYSGNIGEVHWIEVKHWLIGYQKGTKYNVNSYFTDRSTVGIVDDVNKLTAIVNGQKYLLIITTSNPGKDMWNQGVLNFIKKFKIPHLTSLTDPSDFPPSYFLGLLYLSG